MKINFYLGEVGTSKSHLTLNLKLNYVHICFYKSNQDNFVQSVISNHMR